MYIKQISILALGLILSHESFAANPAMRAGALRLNTSSSSTQSTQSVTNPSSTTGALASYERASRLRPNRVQIGAVSSGTTNNANTELLNTVYAEMERVTNAVEQELYVTQRQIDDLKEEIEERDEKIQELEEALEDYEDMKETVKNIPNVYYTKREVDAKGYVMPKTMENAINVAKTSAISSARDQAVAEIENKGFITADTVYQDIAVAKDKAIADAKEAALVAVKDMGFATVGKLNEVVSAERAARQDALKSYATKAQVASDIATAKTAAVDDAVAVVDERGFATVSAVDGKLANLELGVDNETVATIVDDRINAHNFATISAVDSAVLGATVNIRQERENALKSYATKAQLASDIANVKTAAIDDAVAAVDGRGFIKQATADEIFATKTDLTAVDNKFKNISDTVALDLASNDSFKAQVLDSLDSSIGELPGKVTAMETRITSLDNELFDSGIPKFATIADKDGLVARIGVVEGSFAPAVLKEKILGIKENNVNVFALKSDVDAEANARNVALSDINATITVVDNKFGNYTKTADLKDVQLIKDMNASIGNNTSKFAEYTPTATMNTTIDNARKAAVAQATTDRTNALKDYATNSALNTVDGKFANYTTTSAMNTTIDNAKNAAVAQAASDRTNALKDYATQSWVNDKGYATQSWVNSTIETKMNIKDQQTPAM